MKNISTNREKKEQIVGKINDKLVKANTIIFTNYQGLTHQQLENFKKKLKELNAEFLVAKNTLLKRTLEANNLSDRNEQLNQSTGTIFIYGDPSSPLKALNQLIKELKLPTIKFGIFEKKMISDREVVTLANLPSREVLLAQLVGSMQAPIAKMARALNWNLQSFVSTLHQIQNTKK